jgi:hypothetical protein
MARTSNTETTDQTTEPPAPVEQPAQVEVVADAPAPSPRSKPRVIAPKPRVEGDVVLYAGSRYPMADAVELGLVPGP